MSILNIFKKETVELTEKKKPIWELKEYLKTLAKDIKANKIIFKDKQRNGKDYWAEGSLIYKQKRDFRCMHIAYCLLRGTERDKIESPAENNQPNEVLIRRTYDAYSC